MAEDTITRAAEVAGLVSRTPKTETLPLFGAAVSSSAAGATERFAHYGAEAVGLEKLISDEPPLGHPLHPRLSSCGAEVVWAVRHEMARTVDDVLSRRTRALQLDARAALDTAPMVAGLLARELGRDRAWMTEQITDFTAVARGYLLDADGASSTVSCTRVA
jgi:glycerol-3-phosphate dehydrogenase